MSEMPRKTIFLMGAPLPTHLDWANDELLQAPLPPFQQAAVTGENSTLLPHYHRPVKWRILQPLETERAHDYQPDFYYGPGDANFLTTNQLVTSDSQSSYEDDSILSQFYDHSFAVHERSEISASALPEGDTTQMSEMGLESLLVPSAVCRKKGAMEEAHETVSQVPATVTLRVPGKLTDLKDIPTARYLQSIAPQTMTVNLIVGIIAIRPPRRIITRLWKTEYDLVELVVGDETRTGFGVNFWLSPERTSDTKMQGVDCLRRSLATLRPQDIVLLQTIGLSSFQERVYGQSLRKGMTKVDLLHRRLVDATDTGGFYQGKVPAKGSSGDLSQKARKVHDWVSHFVVATEGSGSDLLRKAQAKCGPRLPPNTQ